MRSRPFQHRVMVGMVSDQLSPAERRSLRQLVARLGGGRNEDRRVAKLARAVMAYRNDLELLTAAPKRAAILAQLRAVEEPAQALHLALSATALGIDAQARIREVAPALDLEALRALGLSALRLGSAAHHARVSLNEEGSAGGKPRHDDRRTLLRKAAESWTESGLELRQGSDRSGALTAWESFACDVLALAEPRAKPRAKPRAGLKLAREIAKARSREKSSH